MNSFRVFTLVLVVIISGCVSSSDLGKKANVHTKAGDYYESIGQPNAAKQERNAATKAHNDSSDLFPLLVELFALFSEKK